MLIHNVFKGNRNLNEVEPREATQWQPSSKNIGHGSLMTVFVNDDFPRLPLFQIFILTPKNTRLEELMTN